MRRPVSVLLQDHQVFLYLASSLIAVALGLLVPQLRLIEPAINPLIALLLLATFMAIPLTNLSRSVSDWKFTITALLLNFTAVPVSVWVLLSIFDLPTALAMGAGLVLLAPCIDYVVTFTKMSGGAASQLLALTPLLMIGQMLLLPVYLPWILPQSDGYELPMAAFAAPLIWLILVPLVLAAVVQVLSKRLSAARKVAATMDLSMVPLMMAVLFVVIASQAARLGPQVRDLLQLVPLYCVFVVLMGCVGFYASRFGGQTPEQRRALVFTSVTRNSLVVLPIALSIPEFGDIAGLAVMTQTMVELAWMLVLMMLLPRLIPIGAPGA